MVAICSVAGEIAGSTVEDLENVLARLRAPAADPAQDLSEFCEMAARALRTDACAIVLAEGGGLAVKAVHGCTPAEASAHADALTHGQDGGPAPGFRHRDAAALVASGGRRMGILLVLNREAMPAGGGDADLLALLARQAAAQITARQRDMDRRRIHQIAGIGGLEVDLRAGFKNRRSPEYLALHGLPPDAAQETHEAWVQRIHPEDRARVEAHFLQAVHGHATDYRAEYRIIRPCDGELRWINATAEIERDAAGEAVRLIGVHRDVTERRSAEEALRRADERLRLALNASGTVGLFVWDRVRNRVFADRHLARFFGLDPDRSEQEGATLKAMLSAVHPDDRASAVAAVTHALAADGRFECEVRVVQNGASVRWVNMRGTCERLPGQRPGRLAGVAVDITGRKRVETELAARTAQLEALLATAPAGIWFTDDPEVRTVSRNGFAAKLMRVPQTSVAGFSNAGDPSLAHVRVRRDGADVTPRDLPLQRAMAGEEVRGEEFEFQFNDGSPSVHLYAWASPLRDAAGRVSGAVAVSLDITGRKRDEEARDLLARELNHRINNIFALVGALVSITARRHPEAKPFADGLRERLYALSQAHRMIRPPEGPDEAAGVTVQSLARGLLAPYLDPDNARVTIAGEDAAVGPRGSTALALCLHEMATNAVKYGALSREDGRVAIRCVRADGALHITWTETGGPAVAGPPEKSGFGSKLTGFTITAQLGGVCDQAWRPDGLEMTLRVPLARLEQ